MEINEYKSKEYQYETPETLIVAGVGMFYKNESGIFERNEIDESGNIFHQTFHTEIDENGDIDKFIKTRIY